MAHAVSKQYWQNKAIARVGDALGASCRKRSWCAKPNGGLKQPQILNTICLLHLTNGHRQFEVNQANQVYVGDITYIYTQEGWLYLAVVIDLYSRQIVGWSMAECMKTKLVNDALIMAIWQRKPAKGLLWHTDRGSQYASDNHRKLLKQHGIQQSMSRKGNCWDNAVSESFFHTLKTECVNHENYATHEAAKKSIFDYIEVFYNRQRLHSNNGYLSPVEFEKQFKAA